VALPGLLAAPGRKARCRRMLGAGERGVNRVIRLGWSASRGPPRLREGERGGGSGARSRGPAMGARQGSPDASGRWRARGPAVRGAEPRARAGPEPPRKPTPGGMRSPGRARPLLCTSSPGTVAAMDGFRSSPRAARSRPARPSRASPPRRGQEHSSSPARAGVHGGKPVGCGSRSRADDSGGVLYITGPVDLHSKQNGPQPWYWSPL